MLDGVDLDVVAGSVTVVIGPSGSGKSTLLRCLNALEKVDAGEVVVDGELIGYRRDERRNRLVTLSARRVEAQRRRIGFVFRQFNLFPHLTARANVLEAPLAHRLGRRDELVATADALLASVGLAGREDAYPRQLSGGSSSGWRSPARSPPTPRWCCSTNRRPPSTPNGWPRCWRSSPRSPRGGSPW